MICRLLKTSTLKALNNFSADISPVAHIDLSVICCYWPLWRVAARPKQKTRGHKGCVDVQACSIFVRDVFETFQHVQMKCFDKVDHWSLYLISNQSSQPQRSSAGRAPRPQSSLRTQATALRTANRFCLTNGVRMMARLRLWKQGLRGLQGTRMSHMCAVKFRSCWYLVIYCAEKAWHYLKRDVSSNATLT